MKKFSILLVLLAIAVCFSSQVHAQQAPALETVEILMPGADKCTLTVDNSGRELAITCQMEYPLMKGRLDKYGDIIVSRDGTRSFDVKNAAQLTLGGKKLYESLMGILAGRMLAIGEARIRYASATALWYPQVPWVLIADSVDDAFKKASEADAGDK